MSQQQKPKKKKTYTISRSTQYHYIFQVGGVLFIYSLLLVILSFALQQTALGKPFSVPEIAPQQMVSFLFVTLISLIASVLFALIFIHRFFEPFYQIRDRLNRILEKNLTTRLDLEDSAELKELSEEFNRVLENLERLVLVLRLEQEEVSMIVLNARKEAHLQSTRDTFDRISKHHEKIIEYLLAYRVLGDK